MNTLLNFFRAGTQESSKRLLTITSYVVALGISIYCVVARHTLEGNVLVLLLGLTGASTAQQVISYGKETSKITTKDTEQ